MFRSVSSVSGSRLGVVCPDPVGVLVGLDGLEVATSYVGRSSDIGVLAGVRTAVL